MTENRSVSDLKRIIRKTRQQADWVRDASLRQEFIGLAGTAEAQLLVIGLAADKRSELRELAASVLVLLWEYWKGLSYDGDDNAYRQQIRTYCEALVWTLPLLEMLLQDRSQYVQEAAIIAVSNVGESGTLDTRIYLEHVKKAFSHRAPLVRLTAVRNILYLFPHDKEGDYLLDEETLHLLVRATYDADEDVRDWACFMLHTHVSKRYNFTDQAFKDAMKREDPDSDVYMEAVIGLAKLGYEGEVTDVICDNLRRDDCGNGWVDAALASKAQACKDELQVMYERLRASHPKDSRIKYIEDELGVKG